MRTTGYISIGVLFAALWLCGCADDAGPSEGPVITPLSVEALMKPETCQGCHPQHYREWASSMHAYAAKDPIFLAMNARGQEETNGELGTFCIQCHAPVAVAMNLTKDGLNLDDLPEETKGVTCYFCHNIESISKDHNNPLGLAANNPLEMAMDTVMRGGMGRPGESTNPPPRQSPVHGVAYSPLLDGSDLKSSELCGSCHDIVTPNGVHLERTFHEWQHSKMGDANTREPDQLSCNNCHMRGRTGVVASSDQLKNIPVRRGGVHSHLFPGVDVALTDHPDRDIQEMAIECELTHAALGFSMAIEVNNVIVAFENPGTGHMWPSGATQDRRGFLRVTAYDADGTVIGESGNVALDEGVMAAKEQDPDMLVFRDTMLNDAGDEVHMFWDATSTSQTPVLLPGSPTDGDHFYQRTIYNLFPPNKTAAKVEAQIFVRPIGREVVQDLLDSGHLRDLGYDDTLMQQIPTFPLAHTRMVWELDVHGEGREVRAISPSLAPGCHDRVQCALYPETCDK